MSNMAKRNGRAPFPANNRLVPQHLRVNGTSTIHCYGCNQDKAPQAFSETQLKKAGSRSAQKKHNPVCKMCTPVQPTSLKCVRCARTLPMDEFSKTQRRNQEKATCMECRKLIEDNDSEDDLDLEEDPDWYDGDITDIL